MKIVNHYLIFFIFSFNLIFPGFSVSKEKLAIMNFKAWHNVKKTTVDSISAEVRARIRQLEAYDVLNRDDLNSLAEKASVIKKVDCENNSQCLINFIQKLGIKLMVSGFISKSGDKCSINLQLINTEINNVAIQNTMEKKCECDKDELVKAAKEAAELLMEKKPQRNTAARTKTTGNINAEEKKSGRDDRFITYDNDTVVDSNTGLMWSAEDNGSDIEWPDAKKYCENYRGGGHTDWRLPTLNELSTLYEPGTINDKSTTWNCSKGFREYHINNFFHITCCCMWASKTPRTPKLFAPNFNFINGTRFWDTQSYSTGSRVLPVRNAFKIKPAPRKPKEKPFNSKITKVDIIGENEKGSFIEVCFDRLKPKMKYSYEIIIITKNNKTVRGSGIFKSTCNKVNMYDWTDKNDYGYMHIIRNDIKKGNVSAVKIIIVRDLLKKKPIYQKTFFNL